MKIVLIEDFFHPEAGYQFNILSRYLSAFGHNVIVVTSETDKIPEKYKSFFDCRNIKQKDEWFKEKYGVEIIRVKIYNYISGRAIYNSEIFKIVNSLDPDVLYVNGNDTYIGIRYLLKQHKLNYPIVTDNHMVEIASKNRFSKGFRFFYRQLVTPQIIKHNTKVIRTVDVDYVTKHYAIPTDLTPLIGFGSDTRLFHEDNNEKLRFRNELQIDENTFVCTYAGKLDESKGGLFFAKSIRDKFPIDRSVCFIIVGNTSGEYGKKTEDLFLASDNHIIRFPTQRYIDLPRFFQVADIAVYPKQCSLSFYDSTACGAPALIEDNEIGLQRSEETGCLVFKAGDIDSFRNMIIRYAKLPSLDFHKIKRTGIEYIFSKFNYEDQARKYEQILTEAVNEYRQ